MKKTLLTTILFSGLAALTVRADLIWFEPFNYANGNITTTSGGLWIRHSGTGNDSLVNNKREEIAATGGVPVSRSDDVHRFMVSPYTNTPQLLYYSYIVNVTNLPNAAGTYFTHFYKDTTTFYGKTFATANTNQPGTYRLGVSGASSSVFVNYPADLVTNVDYQVVVGLDGGNTFNAFLWVNPVSANDTFAKATDLTAAPTITGFASRQAGTFGNFFCTISNLATATTYDEAATNVLSTNAVAPIMAMQPASRTNFVTDVVNIFSAAAGQGQGSMSYQWVKNGTQISNPNGNSNVFGIASAAISDTGNYSVIATTPYGLSVTSSSAFLWVTNPPVPPTITAQPPTNTIAYTHQNVSLHVGASGPPTLTYQWYYNNAAATGANVTGADSDTISISDLQSGNGTAGSYYAIVSNPFGSVTSKVAVVTVTNPPAVSVAYLRSLVETSTYSATNTSSIWQVTGTISTFTNLTTGNTASYYLQDGTAGINIFVTFGSTWRPMQGDVVTFDGFLNNFQGNIELEADTTGNPATSYTILSNNIAGLPAPLVLNWAGLATNNNPFLELNVEGLSVMLTNVYFGTNAGSVVSTSGNSTYIVTNSSGQIARVFFSSQDLDTAGQTVPDFARSVVGVLTQNTNANPGYMVTVTRWADVVTNDPPPITITEARSTDGITSLSWTAVPYQYSYSVLAATDVNGPYVPVATGLTFVDANGNYTDHSYLAKLRGISEVPANSSPATGLGSVVLSDDQTKITVNESWSGLTTAATASHIHGPAPAGSNASVLFPFSGVTAATSGSIPQQTFSINPTQVGYLQGGLLYMNVHTPTYPGGEIRAQLIGPTSGGPTTARFFKVVSP